MGIARNIARLVPNGSGLLPNANIEAMAASKLTGQVADANAPSGSVVQVVSATYSTNVNISTGSWSVDYGMGVAIYRNNSTSIFTGMTNLGYTYTVGNMAFSLLVPLFYLDSPATTSSTEYTMYFNCASNGIMSSCVDNNVATITLMEIAA